MASESDDDDIINNINCGRSLIVIYYKINKNYFYMAYQI